MLGSNLCFLICTIPMRRIGVSSLLILDHLGPPGWKQDSCLWRDLAKDLKSTPTFDSLCHVTRMGNQRSCIFVYTQPLPIKQWNNTTLDSSQVALAKRRNDLRPMWVKGPWAQSWPTLTSNQQHSEIYVMAWLSFELRYVWPCAKLACAVHGSYF